MAEYNGTVPKKPTMGLESIHPDWLDDCIERLRFMREHHHLIAPRLYSRADAHTRNLLLFRRNWQRCTPNPYVTHYG